MSDNLTLSYRITVSNLSMVRWCSPFSMRNKVMWETPVFLANWAYDNSPLVLRRNRASWRSMLFFTRSGCQNSRKACVMFWLDKIFTAGPEFTRSECSAQRSHFCWFFLTRTKCIAGGLWNTLAYRICMGSTAKKVQPLGIWIYEKIVFAFILRISKHSLFRHRQRHVPRTYCKT